MSKPEVLLSGKPDYLSVIYKANNHLKDDSTNFNIVIQTDIHFTVTRWNVISEKQFDSPDVIGKNLFRLFNIEFTEGNLHEHLISLKQNGYWSGEIIYNFVEGRQSKLNCLVSYIINESQERVAILFVAQGLNNKKQKQKLNEVESKFDVLINSLPIGVMKIGVDGRIVTCNRKGAEILGLSENVIIGHSFSVNSWKTIRPDGSPFPVHQFPSVVSMQTGFPQRNVVIGIEKPIGDMVWLSINTEALFRPGEQDPYEVLVSFSDITNFVKSEKELQVGNERFYYVSKVTSDAIWDFDLVTNQIYRSDAFSQISDYRQNDIAESLDWWFNKIHPDDQQRVKNKLNDHLLLKKERWDDEYRFEYADGTYKILRDSGIILYKNNKPVRIIGAISDITKERELEQQLLYEKEQQQKALTQAAIKAQEQEKANISCELHDNVNQILMSAKLYMDTAKRTPDEANQLLDQAIKYQLIAMQEIRRLSRTLSAPGNDSRGLQSLIGDIINNLRSLLQIDVHFSFDPLLEEQLNDDEKLTIYRIIQEQSNNIIKYSEATSVTVSVTGKDRLLHLLIADNGKGFNLSEAGKGIGMVNMNIRAASHNGKLTVSSSPGRGCLLEVKFPFTLD
ncbi:MAG TPA: PAS domain-containing protein, partial [Chitinophagaceae bacterium]|nr:PAS domain-containing protein [Chitinophagaceae bacterium]